MNALAYVDIDQGIHKGKMNVALNEKRKKLRGFSFSINISNFEAFLSVFKLTKNPLFLKSEDQDRLFEKGLENWRFHEVKHRGPSRLGLEIF